MQIAGVSEAQFNALRAQLLSNLTEVTGTTNGTITGHGVTANYHYDTVGQTLSVDIIHHPFYIPVASIESQLRNQLGHN